MCDSFSGSPVVKTPRSHCREHRFPDQGTMIPQATWCGQKVKRRRRRRIYFWGTQTKTLSCRPVGFNPDPQQKHLQEHNKTESHYFDSVPKVNKALPKWFSGKECSCQCRRRERLEFSPWVRKIHWRRKWQPTPALLPGKFMDRGAWRAIVHAVAKSRTGLST